MSQMLKSIADLEAGNARFMSGEGLRHDARTPPDAVQGQFPRILVVSCADSRVIPEALFDAGIGELFVCRVAGNVASSETIASLEYAVANIDTDDDPKVLVVLGHQKCGAVGAAWDGTLPADMGYLHLRNLVEYIKPAITAADTEDDAIRLNAQLTADRLVADSAILKDAVADGRLVVTPAYYKLTGEVVFLDAAAAKAA